MRYLQRLSLGILSLMMLVLASATPLLVSGTAAAAFNPFTTVCTTAGSSSSAACKTDGSNPLTGKNGILYRTSRVLGMIAGVGAVVVMMVGGLRYINSAGDARKAAEARSVIVGAAVGLLVIALAEAIIALVVNVVR
ncbi:MAG TPA: hypothetical protein VLH84_04010 [Patescibacteria group bacterium]|nr:hypothetical protein [Patescibacteria group bacterium]